MTTNAASTQALAIRQLNNAANNLFNASEASGYSDGKRENLVRAAHVVLALSHTIEYGEAYLPQLKGNASAYLQKFPSAKAFRVAEAIRKTTHERG